MKTLAKMLLVVITLLGLLFVIGAKNASAQQETPSCQQVTYGEGTFGEWVVSEDGLSRTRVGTFDSFDSENPQFPCGPREIVQTEYLYCFHNDGNYERFASPAEAEQAGADLGHCPSPTPAQTPDPDVCANIDGIQTSVPDGMHLDATQRNCVNWSDSGGGQSGGGTTSTGQVLGASTLASTGNLGVLFTALATLLGISTAAVSLYAFKKSA